MSQPPVPPTPPAYSSAPYNPPQGGGYAPPPADKYNVLAIISLVSAFFVSLVAVITGHMALGQIKRTGEKGRGLAITGLVLGYLGILSALIFAAVLIFMLIAGVGIFAATANNYDDNYYSTSVPSPTEPSDVLSGDLTFAAGSELAASSQAQFTDPFVTDLSWTVSSPDDGAGNWSYLDPSGLCTVSFHQGALGGQVPVTAGDDRATTAEFLAVVLNTDAGTITSKATDSSMAYNFEGSGTVDTLLMQGTDADGSIWKLAGRAFGTIDGGVYVDVTCKSGGDLEGVYDTVTTKAAITVF
ncbi:DUF4190 domain-containing protein [Agreia sp. COWG]|uniref:DUF4190 domain-containing protein n=1 Tax=Agreia sp. COWG TaxID=2773266 RepID=UPI001928784D|nr:DUF4190 domain-containing protein [Agreia sp. COWG]CAD6006940.1 conserved protein of unknown function [Agreia sp. COWG]